MNQDAIDLFRELADRSPEEREGYYARHPVPPAIRAEVESLLRFDGPAGPSLDACLARAAEEALLAGEPIPQVIAPLSHHWHVGTGRHGKSLPGDRHQAGPRGRDQSDARGFCRRLRAHGALRARGAGAGVVEPSEHRGDLRRGRPRAGDGTGGRPTLAERIARRVPLERRWRLRGRSPMRSRPRTKRALSIAI